MNDQLHYSLLIAWSEEDQAYVVSFLESEANGLIGHTHCATYEDALRKGEEALPALYGQQIADCFAPESVRT